MPCLRETVTNAHNSGGLLPVEATASGNMFVSVQVQFVDITKSTFIVTEVPRVYAQSATPTSRTRVLLKTSAVSATTLMALSVFRQPFAAT